MDITDDMIEKALDYLRDTATESAQHRANRIYMEEARKVIKAKLMGEHADLSIGAQEREAYSDERYTEHLEAMRTAIEFDENSRFLRAAAEAKIEAWRTLNANLRTQGKIG